MRKPILIAAAVAIAVIIVAAGVCSFLLPTGTESRTSTGTFSEASFAQSTASPASAPFPMEAPPEPEMAAIENGLAKSVADDASEVPAPSSLDHGEQKIISTASFSIQVKEVPRAVEQIRNIAEDLGGFVEHLSSFGGENQENANLTIRVPQEQFNAAVDRIANLGNVQAREMGREDVSEQFVDLEARLNSLQKEEASLLSLLELATGVADVLAIERELSRVRSEIERHQGRLDFLSRRVDLATIHVTLFPPQDRFPQPPSADLTVEVEQVSDRVDEVKNLVESHDGGLDRVFRSTRNERDQAELSFRIFPQDFLEVMEALEDQGKVVNKEVVEATGAVTEGEDAPKTPNARINVNFRQPESSGLGLWLFIGLPIGLIVLVVVLAAGFYGTYQRGLRHRERFLG